MGMGMGGNFAAVAQQQQQQQPLIRLPPQQMNTYMELGNRRVEYPNQGAAAFGIGGGGTFQGVPAHGTTIPSLSSGQGFYTVESLQGASMLPTPGIPAPSLQNNRGGGGLGMVGLGPPALPKPYSALHLNAPPLQQYSAAEKNEDGIGRGGALLPKPYSALHSNARSLYGVERKEDGGGRAAPLPKPYSAMYLNTRTQYGAAADQVEDRSYMDMDMDRERQRYNGHAVVYSERPGPPHPPLLFPNSPGFAFGWPAEREQAAVVVERPKGRDFGRDREKGRKRDVHATERFQGRGSVIRRQPTIPGPPPPPLAARNVVPMKFKPKKKPIIVLGPGGTGWCELCELECKTANMLQQHLVGKRHRRNVLKRESEADLGSQNANNGSKPNASGSSENASGLGKHIATEPPEDDTVLKKQRIVDDPPDLSTDAVLDQCEQASDVVWKSSDISSMEPLLAPEQCEQASDVVCKSSDIRPTEPLLAPEQCKQASDAGSKSSDVSTTELLAPEQCEQASDAVCKSSNISTTEPVLAPEQCEQPSDAVCKFLDINTTEPLLAPEQCEQASHLVCKFSDISPTEPVLAPEECEQSSDVVCKSPAVSMTEPLLALAKSSNGIDYAGTTSNGVDDEGGGDVGAILNGDVDGYTTSTTTVEIVAKPGRKKEDIYKTMPPEDLVHIEIGEAVKLVEVSIENR
ncbi:hypothetical protein CY35_17G054100 [Sphagnum magellanicum]|nr:hypothetical protein CY35_17G054100 [Sphagnum magellanicum]